MFKLFRDPKAAKIAVLNDSFRRHTGVVATTHGVMCDIVDLHGLMWQIAVFSRFAVFNDPRGKHDFGSLIWEGRKVFWRIDYYNVTRTAYCDPLSPECKRVLTVMLAEEY